jgi:hypothetical protein
MLTPEEVRENFFSYITDIPSVDYVKQYLGERGNPLQSKGLTIIIPDRNEDPEALRATLIQLALSNYIIGMTHQIGREYFRANRIVVSDQSDKKTAETNRGLLYTAGDVLRDTLSNDYIPEIYYLPFDTEMSEIVYEHLKHHLEISSKDRGKPILGKGINMALSSLLSSDLTEYEISDEDTVLVFMDAENKEVKSNDLFLLGSPLIYEGSPVLFSKAAFRRYHMEGDKRKIGGRVNASLGVPLINMFRYKGLMPIKKSITYPLSGEIGIDSDLFRSLDTSKRYGVETTTLLQLFRKNEKGEIKLPEDNFVQVDLGINMDEPLAEGKSPREVIKGIRRMSEDILSSTFQIMGDQIRETWGSSKDFMKLFGEFQRYSIERWMESHDIRPDSHGSTPITGRIDSKELRRNVHGVVEQGFKEFYDEEGIIQKRWREMKEGLHHLDGGFIPPISNIRDDIGEDDFNEFRKRLIDKAERIHPQNKEELIPKYI